MLPKIDRCGAKLGQHEPGAPLGVFKTFKLILISDILPLKCYLVMTFKLLKLS